MGRNDPLSWMLRWASCRVGGGSRECSECDMKVVEVGIKDDMTGSYVSKAEV